MQTTEAGTQVVTFPASDIGLPTGGSAVLTISGGGYNYSGTAAADASGNVTFDIPMIASGTRITVSLSVNDANGALLYAGSKEQVVRGDSVRIDLSLTRQFWTLPDSIRVIASPAGILYNPATADTATSTLSIEGFENAPAGVAYVWTDDTGAQLGTGATLTRTANEVTGGIAPTDEITRTYTVTASYTDTTGTAKTASASASVTVGLAVTLPAFSISMTAPASAAPATGADSPWSLSNLTDSFTLTPVSGSGSFPGGTTFHWEIQATGGTTITRTTAVGEDCTVSPADLGLDDSSMGTQAAPTTITVRCTAKNDRADADVDAPAVTQSAYLLYTIPSFSVLITPPSSYKADKSDTSNPLIPKYALVNTTDLFTFAPVTASGEEFPSGTTFEWSVILWTSSGSSSSYIPTDTTTPGIDAVASVSGSGLAAADIGHTPTQANKLIVNCIARNPRVPVPVTVSANAEVFVLYSLPAFTIDTTMSAAGYSASLSSLGTPSVPVAVPVFALTSLDYPFTFTANPGTASFPTGSVARWEIQAKELTASKFVTVEPPAADVFTETSSPSGLGLRNAGQTGATAANTISTAAAAASPISIQCTISHPYALEDVTVNATVQVFRLAIPKIKIDVADFNGDTGTTTAEGSKVFYMTAADLSQNFTLTALVDSSDPTVTFPSGTQFQWNYPGIGASYSTADAAPFVQTAGSLFNTTSVSNTLGTPYTLQCQAVLDGSPVSGATATVDVYLVRGMSASTLAGKTTAQLGSTKLSGSGTEADPYVLPSIIGLEDSSVRSISLKNKMNNTWQKYCDLSNTVLPDTMTDMFSAFNGFTYMTAAPVIPSTVTNMEQCFYRCTYLTTAPVIPEGVTNMKQCFYQCPKLTTAPAIPEGVTNMEDCFYQCIYLTTAPVIPSTVTNMRGCFEKCSALTTAPDIPEGVTDMTKCFEKCSALTTAPAIPSSVDNMDRCFEECTSLTAAPAIPEGVINMTKCFNECTSLTTASIIPSTVTDLTRCFKGCINLTGDVVIRANITDSDNYRGMFDVHSDGSGSYHWPGASNPINIYVPTEAARNALITALKTPVDAISANTNFVYTEGSDPNPDGSIGTGNIKIYVGEP